METIEKFNERVMELLELSSKVNDAIAHRIETEAPVIVYNKLCAQLVEVMRNNPAKTPEEVYGAANLLMAISILKDLYPQLTEL